MSSSCWTSTVLRIDEGDGLGCLGDGSHRFVVAGVADVDDVESAVGHALDLMVHFGDQRAHGVHQHRRPLSGPLCYLRGGTVGRQHHRGAGWNLVDVVDEHNAGSLEHPHNRLVVHDLVIAVHRGLVIFHPFPDVAVHIVKIPRIGIFLSDRMGFAL